MSSRRHTPEQIINKLWQAEVEIANGATISQAAKKIGVTDHTYYRWRTEYGGMRMDQAKRLEDACVLQELEKENAQLKKLVAEQALDIAILKEAASGNF
jgi:putative transposase